MKKSFCLFSLIFIALFFLVGCDLAQPKQRGQAPPAVPPLQQAEALPQDAPEQTAEEDTVMVRAETGVGVRGQSLTPVTANNPVEIVTAPIAAMFRTEQRLIFQRVTQAENFFRAEHGRLPNSHEEYMQEIIQKNDIRLPTLPPNQEYFYDADAGELKTKRPR